MPLVQPLHHVGVCSVHCVQTTVELSLVARVDTVPFHSNGVEHFTISFSDYYYYYYYKR